MGTQHGRNATIACSSKLPALLDMEGGELFFVSTRHATWENRERGVAIPIYRYPIDICVVYMD